MCALLKLTDGGRLSMAHGVDHKMENLTCAAVISSVSELNPEKPRQNEFSQFEMQICIS